MGNKIVLAYSGGLDTTVAIRWLKESYGYDVIALTIDVGNEKDFTVLEERARTAGAEKLVVRDAKQLFIEHFVWPALQADAVYEDGYPLATALARPLMAYLMCEVAREESATAVAHGCTGKGNDQVRFDVSISALAPHLKIVAPVREWKWSRDDEIEFARANDIPIPVTQANPYSTDENLWGRSIEAGVLEDPWVEPPDDVWTWTSDPRGAPDEPAYRTITFERGRPLAIDDERLDGVTLVRRLNELAGAHGVGRVDQVENRLVGIKSREVYEAPAAVTLLAAHRALEQLTLTREQVRFKQRVSQEYADLIYNGRWFTTHHRDLAAYVQSTQRHVSGDVRVRLHRGTVTIAGKRAPDSLYSLEQATYGREDQFDQDAALGFIKIWGLPVRLQAERQLLREAEGPLAIASPE